MKLGHSLAVGLIVALVGAGFLRASAQQIPTRFSQPDNSPIQITNCLAQSADPLLQHFPGEFSRPQFGLTTTINTRLSFVNASGRALGGVQFGFSADGSSWLEDLQAPFAPGFSAGSSPMFEHLLATPFVSQVSCFIKLVKFADGSQWRNPAFK